MPISKLWKRPSNLRGHGRRLWESVGPRLVEAGTLEELDKETFGLLCRTYHRMLTLDALLESEGYVIQGENKTQKKHPAFSECLVHVKGSKALNPLELELWQQAIVAHLFGWKSKETHLRRFRELFAFVPRKNGKTILAAGISLYSLFCVPERGAEIYCAASDRSQARLLFDVAKMMTLKDHDLRKRAEVLRHEIRFPERDSVFKVISSEAASKHGYSSSLVVFDELHAIADRELVDVLTTSLAARLEPMLVFISTAGYDQNSICFEKFDYARKVRERVIHDPAFSP